MTEGRWLKAAADFEFLSFLLVQGVPVALRSSPILLSLMQGSFQVAHPGVAPFQLMLKVLSSSLPVSITLTLHPKLNVLFKFFKSQVTSKAAIY